MTGVPKLPPDAVVRRDVEGWLDCNAARRVRIVAGQPGCGKTIAVAAWARGRVNPPRWITVAPGATETALRAHLHASSSGEFVIDGADRASACGRAFLAQLAHDAPADARFVLLVRDARPFAAAASAHDMAHADVAALRFDDAEIEKFCTAHGVASTAKERRHLVAATGGWAFAVTGTVRYAAALGGTLAAAFPRWFATARPLITQLLDDAAADAPAAASAFDRVARGVASGADDLRDASHGAFFVEREGETYRVNPVVASLRGNGRESARPAPAVLHMFGRFRVTIGNDEVCFSRRRARALIQFLAVRGDGSATRDELLRTFWPGIERRTAAGALVDTCSTIRRALAQCVGRDAVDNYFVVNRNAISLQLANVVSTAHRFSTHIGVASGAYERGDLDAAVAHWSAALRLHSAPLLSGEPPAPWIADTQRAFDDAARNAVHLRATVPSMVSDQAVRALTA